MESKQFESAESKEANSSHLSDPLPGSASIKTSSLNSSSNLIEETNVLNNSSGTSSGGYSSDDGDFMSGDEDFETASEMLVLPDPYDETAEKGVIGEDSGDHFVGSSEFPMPIDNELADDDAEKGSKVGVLQGGEVEGKGVAGDEASEGKPETAVGTVSGENLNSNSDELVKESVFAGTPDGGFEKDKVIEFSQLSEGFSSAVKDSSIPEGEVEEVKLRAEEGLENRKIEALENVVNELEAKVANELVEEHAVESDNTKEISAEIVGAADGVKVTSEGDSVVEAVHVDLTNSGVAVVGEVEEKEEADGSARLIDESDQANPETVEEIAVQDSSTDPVNADVAVTAESELVEADGVKFTPEGDSVVEDIHVDLAEPGVAVVGEMEKNEEADESAKSHNESERVNAKVVEQHAVQNSNVDHVNADIVAATDSKLVEADGVKFTPGGDSVVEDVVAKVEENGEADGFVEHDQENEKKSETQAVGEVDYVAKQIGSVVENSGNGVEDTSTRDLVGADESDIANGTKDPTINNSDEEELKKTDGAYVSAQDDILENGNSGKSIVQESDEPTSIHNQELITEVEDEMKIDNDEASVGEGSVYEGETDGTIFGSSEAAKQFIEELGQGSGGGSHSGAERIDGQIVTDSDEEVDTDEEEGEGKELFDSAALAALLKAATGAGSDGGNITITSQDGSRLFSVERPAGLGSSVQSLRPAPRANRSSFLTPLGSAGGGESENLSEEEKGKLEKLQSIRVKFLRLVQRLGLSPDESVAAQVLYRLALVAGRQTGQLFGLDAAKRTARQLEEDEKDDLDFSLNILVLGKSGVGKSATINAIFGEEKARIDAFQPATATVKEITGMVDGVKIRVFDTPGLKSSVMEQSFNCSVLSSVKKLTKKSPLDIVLYVDRLDAQTRDLNDLPLLRTVTGSLGPSIWRSAIVTLTHAASAPPDGPSGSPLSYDVFVTQRSQVLQQSIGQAVGDLRMMSPSLMNPVSLVENHPSCRNNREGQKVLPNGQTWRPQLMLLCYSMKILSEANSLSKPQDPFDHRKFFGFRSRSPPLPYMLSSMLQSRAHPKLSSEQGGDNGDSDIDLADLSDSDQEEDEDEYDQLPPFKPLRKSQLAKLSNEQRKAYFEEYDYRVKLLQKKQWKEELKRLREMKKKGKDGANDYGFTEEDTDSGSAAPVSVPLPDMALPPSFDGDNPAHRYRFLEPTSQFLARPVLDTHGWDHDCGYDGVNLEQSLAIANQFPAVVSVQLTKDKKEFSINLDSSIATKHGENGSSMAGFDIQAIGKQLAYIVRGETKFKNLRKNKTAAGISVTFLGENVVTGLKVEDQITIGKQYSLVGSAGTVQSQQDAAYGANIEVQRRELDYPIGQVQSSFGLSIIKWRGDLALGFNSLAQFSLGRSSKVAVRAGINNKLSGQITVRTSSSEHLSLALASVIPTAIAIYKKFYPGIGEKYSIY